MGVVNIRICCCEGACECIESFECLILRIIYSFNYWTVVGASNGEGDGLEFTIGRFVRIVSSDSIGAIIDIVLESNSCTLTCGQPIKGGVDDGVRAIGIDNHNRLSRVNNRCPISINRPCGGCVNYAIAITVYTDVSKVEVI